MEQRAVIKFNAKLGKSASETFRSMQQVYGSQCLDRTAVFEWHKRFLEGRETLEDDKKSGRPILVRTPEMIEKVRDFVANDRNASLKMMEEALNISRETIRTILHEDLGKTKFVPHTLRSDQKSARINYSRDIVAAAENNPNFLKSIVTGDETWCFQYDPETKRQSAEWNDNIPKAPSYIKDSLHLVEHLNGTVFDLESNPEYVLASLDVVSLFTPINIPIELALNSIDRRWVYISAKGFHTRLQFTLEVGTSGRLSFLDTMLVIDNQRIIFDIYHKKIPEGSLISIQIILFAIKKVLSSVSLTKLSYYHIHGSNKKI
ncbi:SETMR methyltransferase, partial [Acromyrmex charruanus]